MAPSPPAAPSRCPVADFVAHRVRAAYNDQAAAQSCVEIAAAGVVTDTLVADEPSPHVQALQPVRREIPPPPESASLTGRHHDVGRDTP